MHRPAIVRGLGRDVRQVIQQQFDDFMGDRWEAAFRAHLTVVAPNDPRLSPVIDVGQFWKQNIAGTAILASLMRWF